MEVFLAREQEFLVLFFNGAKSFYAHGVCFHLTGVKISERRKVFYKTVAASPTSAFVNRLCVTVAYHGVSLHNFLNLRPVAFQFSAYVIHHIEKYNLNIPAHIVCIFDNL